jgi:hypothetical protein
MIHAYMVIGSTNQVTIIGSVMDGKNNKKKTK